MTQLLMVGDLVSLELANGRFKWLTIKTIHATGLVKLSTKYNHIHPNDLVLVDEPSAPSCYD